MAKRDTQSHLAVKETETISLTTAGTPGDFVGTGINIQGFSRGFTIAIAPSRAVAVGDDITYKFQSSSDNGVADAWVDLPSEAILPTWKQTGNTIEEHVAGWQQTIGNACSGELYVRVVFSTTALTADIDLVITPILTPDQTPFVGWSASPPTDGQP